MKVQIVATDTAIDEQMTIDADIEALVPEEIIRAINEFNGAGVGDFTPDALVCQAFVKDANTNTHAFVFSAQDVLIFGSYLVVGIVYVDA